MFGKSVYLKAPVLNLPAETENNSEMSEPGWPLERLRLTPTAYGGEVQVATAK